MVNVRGFRIELLLLFIIIDPCIWSSIQNQKKPLLSEENTVCDIYSGREYRKNIEFLLQPANISLSLNTDGVSIYHSSKISIWPVWIVINELPSAQKVRALKLYLWYYRLCTHLVCLSPAY